MPDVAHDADDSARSQELDGSADRILARKVLPRDGIVDDGDRLAALAVVVGKEPALEQGDPHDAEVVW